MVAFLYGVRKETGMPKTFYIESFLCNPAFVQAEPTILWNAPEGRKAGKRPSYCMVNVGSQGKRRASCIAFFHGAKCLFHVMGR